MALTNSWLILWLGTLLGAMSSAGLTVVMFGTYRSPRLAAILAIAISVVVFGLIALFGGLLS